MELGNPNYTHAKRCCLSRHLFLLPIQEVESASFLHCGSSRFQRSKEDLHFIDRSICEELKQWLSPNN